MYRLSINFSLHKHFEAITNEIVNVYCVPDYADANALLSEAERFKHPMA